MKKTIIVLISTVGILLVFGLILMSVYQLNEKTAIKNWKVVTIEDVGTFRAPQEWMINYNEDIIYLTDKPFEDNDKKIYLAGSTWIIGECSHNFPPYKLFDNVELLRRIKDVNYSNSAGYRLEEYNISGDIEKRYTIHFWNSNKAADFIVWDDLVDKKTIIKIAKSYIAENK